MHILFTLAYFSIVGATCLLFSDFNPWAKTYPTTLEAVEALKAEESL